MTTTNLGLLSINREENPTVTEVGVSFWCISNMPDSFCLTLLIAPVSSPLIRHP